MNNKIQRVGNSRGFTLVEVLLASMLSALVFVGIASSLVQGVKLFEKLKVVDGEQELEFFMERLTHDLKNSASYSLIPFSLSDTKESLSFAALLLQGDETDPVSEAKPVRVEYSYDKEARTLVRIEESRTTDKNKIKKEVLAPNIASIKFTLSPEGSGFPKKVGVYLEYDGPGHLQILEKYISIMTGSW